MKVFVAIIVGLLVLLALPAGLGSPDPLFDNNTNYIELRDSGPGGTGRVIGAPDVAGGLDAGLLGGTIGALAILVGGGALGSEYPSQSTSSGNASLDEIRSKSSEPLPNSVYDQVVAYMMSKSPGLKLPPLAKIFDNNKNYMELGKDNGPGGTGVVPGSVLNTVISLMDYEGFDPAKFAKNFTATTLPADRGPTIYMLELIDAILVSKSREIGYVFDKSTGIWGPPVAPIPSPSMKFSEPTEMKGGTMERSEMMTSTGIPNTGASPAINVPVGHEELINSYQKAFDSMPVQLKSVMRQGRVWFASSGHGEIQGTAMDYYKGDVLENAVADLTVNGINGVPQPISQGDLAYTLADMLDQTYGEFSKPHGPNGGYDSAVNNDFAANPATPKYVTPAAADWESTHFGEDSQYSEDFKESVRLWVTKHSDFAKTYPNRSRWLDIVLNRLL